MFLEGVLYIVCAIITIILFIIVVMLGFVSLTEYIHPVNSGPGTDLVIVVFIFALFPLLISSAVTLATRDMYRDSIEN